MIDKIFESKRLIFRGARITDAEEIFDLWDPINHRDDDCYKHYTLDKIKEIRVKMNSLETGILKVATHKETGEIVGVCTIGNFPPIDNAWGFGIDIKEKFYGQKYISEITNAIVNQGKENGIDNIIDGGYFREELCTEIEVVVETDRLITRNMELRDVDEVYKIWNDPISLESHQETEYSIDYIKNCTRPSTLASSLMMVVILKETGQIVGTCRIACNETPYMWNFGYFIHPDHRRKGYASEILQGIIDTAKKPEYKVKKVYGGAYAFNVASRKVMEKCGMTLVNLDDEDADYEITI